MACGIRKCTAHAECVDQQPHLIPLAKGDLIITSNSITFKTPEQSHYLYEVTYPFTREELACLNEVTYPEPNLYVAAIRMHKRSQRPKEAKIEKCVLWEGDTCLGELKIKETEPDSLFELRQQLTIEKALVRQHLKTIQEKDREIIMLKVKLNL